MTFDLTTFTRIVRPARVLPLVEALPFVHTPTEEPVLLHGHGEAAVDLFEQVAPHVGWGSAVAISGVPTDGIDIVDRIEQIAQDNFFRSWFRGGPPTGVPGFPDGARSWVKSEWNGDTYGSHLPYLLEAVRRTTGPVLELGSGMASTTQLHDVCTAAGRLLITVDNDEEWLAKFRYLKSPQHILVHLPDPSLYPMESMKFGVVFVDHAPGETRGRAIERARHRAEVLVCHDTEDLGYGLEELLGTFTHRRDFRRMRPWTTVVSMTTEVWR